MDLKTVRDKILANLDEFEEQEKRVIILKLLDFVKELDEQNNILKNQNNQIVIDEKRYEAQVQEIFSKANEKAELIVQNAEKAAKERLIEIEEQGKAFLYELINRLEGIVKHIQELDEEAKMYRLHVLTIFKKTLFKFSESNYHILKLNDEELRELINFYKNDDYLQKHSDHIMKKLARFNNYLEVSSGHVTEYNDENIKKIEAILHDEDKIEHTEVKIENNIKELEPEKKETSKLNTPSVEEKDDDDDKPKFIDVFNKYYR